MRVSVIIVSYNTRDILKQSIEALLTCGSSHDLEIFVVDNNSADNSTQMIKENFRDVILIENDNNAGFAAANNQAYTRSTGDYIILLNPDAFVKEEAIDRVIEFMESTPGCGICGARLVNLEGKLDPSARRFPNSIYKFFSISGLSAKHPSSKILGRGDFKYFDHKSIQEVDWVPGTFTVFRRSMLTQLGLFDEQFYIYYEETDLCLRAKKAGWKVFFIPDAEIIHIGGACSKTRKDKKYDDSGSQILGFRMMSECIYFRKNFGLFSVLANAGVECVWHLLRFVANLRSFDEERTLKRQQSATIISHSIRAMTATRFGAISPERPW